MKRILMIIALATTTLATLAQTAPDPVADPQAVVTSGRARFTVLTPQMIRIQYSTTSQFEDRATFAVLNRRLPVPRFSTREADGYLYIETDSLQLRYRLNGVISPQLKTPTTLQITLNVDGRQVVWYPGKEDALNLRGTKRTLDTASGDNQRPDLEDGIISRAGWAIVDESPRTRRGDGSTTFAFDGQEDGIDWLARPVDQNAYDWYFMGYGHDYRRAIGDYTKIAGRQPMPPLYALGYWYSKYERYSQQDFINLTNEIRQNQIPIDVMIMDMDWHLDGWTGWTWNRSLIPNPEGLIRWMHQQGLKVSLNLHPADGIGSHEDHFSEIRADLGLTGDRVPWNLENPDFYRSFFGHIIREREQQGVDFWWLDWQQNLTSAFVDGLSETFWCNHVFYNDMRLKRPERRPIIFHRWGGLGSHRYPIGFSGDTYGTFGSLAFQPYFTATASNVCFGYWGHDLGGHMQIGEKNPELMLRWLQFGAFSPIMRTHGASQAGNERRIWMYPNFSDMLEAVRLRYRLMPYIYTAARQAYDTGISICRPLYYDWPEAKQSYREEGEYMFGDDILVSPIVTAAEGGQLTAHSPRLRADRHSLVYQGRRHRALQSRRGQPEVAARRAGDHGGPRRQQRDHPLRGRRRLAGLHRRPVCHHAHRADGHQQQGPLADHHAPHGQLRGHEPVAQLHHCLPRPRHGARARQRERPAHRSLDLRHGRDDAHRQPAVDAVCRAGVHCHRRCCRRHSRHAPRSLPRRPPHLRPHGPPRRHSRRPSPPAAHHRRRRRPCL